MNCTEASLAGDQRLKGSKKVGPGHFMVNCGGGLYMAKIWLDRLAGENV